MIEFALLLHQAKERFDRLKDGSIQAAGRAYGVALMAAGIQPDDDPTIQHDESGCGLAHARFHLLCGAALKRRTFARSSEGDSHSPLQLWIRSD
ncbi:MAG TPA: hypothetical protein VGF85_06660 [Opitutaceae bacterium]|jgi:hypothetical protein